MINGLGLGWIISAQGDQIEHTIDESFPEDTDYYLEFSEVKPLVQDGSVYFVTEGQNAILRLNAPDCTWAAICVDDIKSFSLSEDTVKVVVDDDQSTVMTYDMDRFVEF